MKEGLKAGNLLVYSNQGKVRIIKLCEVNGIPCVQVESLASASYITHSLKELEELSDSGVWHIENGATDEERTEFEEVMKEVIRLNNGSEITQAAMELLMKNGPIIEKFDPRMLATLRAAVDELSDLITDLTRYSDKFNPDQSEEIDNATKE